MEIQPRPDPSPPERGGAPTDADRERVVERLQNAVGEGRLTLEEFCARLDVVFAAPDQAGLDIATGDLPAAPVVGTSRTVNWTVGVLGDTKRRGRWRIPEQTKVLTLLGDVELDLREAYAQDEHLTIRVWSLLGDVSVVVPEGIEVDIAGFGLLGDRTVELAPVPRKPGTPVIRVVAYSLLGDLSVRTKQPGRRYADAVSRFLDRLSPPPPASP